MYLMPHKFFFSAKCNTAIVVIIGNKITGLLQGADLLFFMQVAHIFKIRNRTKVNTKRANGCKKCLHWWVASEQIWFYGKCGKNDNDCSFFLSFLYYVPSEWIVPQLHSIGSILKKMVFLIAVVSLLSLPFPQSQFINSLHFILFISLLSLAHHTWKFHVFPIHQYFREFPV